jgi:hypothetical protein
MIFSGYREESQSLRLKFGQSLFGANQGSITLRLATFLHSVFGMSLYFDHQHNPSSYFVKLAKNVGSIQDGGSKSDF